MNDAEIVAAIAAGQLDGLAAVLDRYVAPLFDDCHRTAPEVAADVVSDTFIIGWEKLGALSEPGQLHAWLREVAENECFRRSLDGDVQGSSVTPPPSTLPPGLPSRVLTACADNTPPGRAYRISVVYQAGPFANDGFPKSGHRFARWRRRFPGIRAPQLGVGAR